MTDKLYLGIDPGATGCLALLDTQSEYVEHLLMPTTKTGKRSRVSGAAVGAWLAEYSGRIAHVFVERVGARPGESPHAAFSFGHSAGLVEGVIAAAGLPVTLVTPQVWKRHAGLTGSNKDSARSRAVQLYPGVRDLDQKAKGQALADALLIGRYGVERCV
ncbi:MULTISPECIES: hypothetical protein [unclassified Thioalkalivibrio]|uniref:hypothetical protein n=1 Tax=unclassified Thioalkalivibrio TaxID=2621013 RepID=UPI000360C06F|nr:MULTISPECIES: hypothetical protein [unclassified Thioalkalivibrio]